MISATRSLAAMAILCLSAAPDLALADDKAAAVAAKPPRPGGWFMSQPPHAAAGAGGLDLRANPDAFRGLGDADVIADIVVSRQPVLDYSAGGDSAASRQIEQDLFGSNATTEAPLGSSRSSDNDECRAGSVCSATGGAHLSDLFGH